MAGWVSRLFWIFAFHIFLFIRIHSGFYFFILLMGFAILNIFFYVLRLVLILFYCRVFIRFRVVFYVFFAYYVKHCDINKDPLIILSGHKHKIFVKSCSRRCIFFFYGCCHKKKWDLPSQQSVWEVNWTCITTVECFSAVYYDYQPSWHSTATDCCADRSLLINRRLSEARNSRNKLRQSFI